MNNPYKKIVGAVLAVAIAGGGAAIWVSKKPNTPVPIGLANIWVDNTAGTCSRSNTPVSFSDPASCGGSGPTALETGYAIAQPGDVIGIKCGINYGDQFIGDETDVNGFSPNPAFNGANSTAKVIMQPGCDTSSSASFRLLTIQNSSGIDFKGQSSLPPGQSGANYNFKILKLLIQNWLTGPLQECEYNTSAGCPNTSRVGPHNILVENVKGQTFSILNSHDITINGGEWGPNHPCYPTSLNGNPNPPGGSGFLVHAYNLCATYASTDPSVRPWCSATDNSNCTGSDTGDYSYTETKIGGSTSEYRSHDITLSHTIIFGANSYDLANIHAGGMFLTGVNNFKMDHSRMFENVVYHIQMQELDNVGGDENLTLENNQFGSTTTGIENPSCTLSSCSGGNEAVAGQGALQPESRRQSAPTDSVTASAGGTIPAGTYQYAVITRTPDGVYVDASSNIVESDPGRSDENDPNGSSTCKSVTVTGSQKVTVALKSGPISSEQDFQIFRSAAGAANCSGALLVGTVAANSTSFVDDGSVTPASPSLYSWCPTSGVLCNTAIDHKTNWIIRYNSIANSSWQESGKGGVPQSGCSIVCSSDDIKFIGNISNGGPVWVFNTSGGASLCSAPGWTIDNNAWRGATTCGTNSVQNAGNPWTSCCALTDPTNDLHLTSSATSLIDAITNSTGLYGITDDFEGDVRPQGSGRDFGADERVVASTGGGASQATCSPSPCTQGSPVSHTINAPDSTQGGSGGPLPAQTRTYDYITERPNNLVGNAPLVVVNVADMTGSTFDEISAANKFQVLMLPPWNVGQVATPTVQARLSPVPQPANCGVGGVAPPGVGNVCDNIPAIKAILDTVIAAGGVDTSRIYITGPSKGGLEATDAVCDTRTYSYFSAMANVSWYSMVQNTNTTPASSPSQTTPGFCPSMLGTDRTAGDGIGGTKLSPPFNNMSMLFAYGTADTVACTSSNNAPAGNCMDLGWVDNQNRWVYSGPQMAGEASPPSSNGATGRSGGGSSVMFGAVMGCSGTPSQTLVDTPQGGNVTEKIYTGCTHSNRATATIRVNGAGHSYDALDLVDNYSSEQAIWDFFAAYGGP
jgi:poly(3-hydroxybutyrate) depolymerase